MKSRFLLISMLFLFVFSLLMLPVSSAAATSSAVYTDGLSAGWEDWSWAPVNINLANASPLHAGGASVAITYTGAWSGFQLGYGGNSLDVSAYDSLRFWVHGGTAGGQTVVVQVNDTAIAQNITPQANTWTMVDVPLASLGSPRSVSTLAWFNNTAGSQPVFYLDDISFVGSGAPTPTSPPPGAGPALSVDAAAGQHAISPYIYGMNYATEAIANVINLPVRRWGGNSTTRYNWEINVHNTGMDWYFQNIPDSPANSADSFITQNTSTGTETLMTVPLIGWTPKRRLEDHPYDCGFKVSLYGAQDSVDPWDTDCGNGKSGNVNIVGNDPTDTSKVITPAFVTTWVNHLTTTHGTAANGGVQFYNLDNEPGLWHETHRDVHPQPLTYDEIRDRTYAYAAALKAADPSALTLGPAEDGWCRYFFSAADQCNPSGADRTAHGNVDYVAWYLAQMKLYEQNNGVRILDYFDLHIYPQGSGVYSESLGSAATQALRLRSTRQLWDSTYVDESWINDMDWQGDTVQLIPRMKAWVANNYPGTKLAITEYNWGALGHLNGALAQADILGIFGREGVDLATLWGPPTDVNAPGIFAFRMYRNYDGAGAAFGETSLQAASADQGKLAIYAAQRASDNALTLMVINKTSESLTSTLSLANFQPETIAQVYRYSAANLSAIIQQANQNVTSSGFTASFPANSITLFVILPDDAGTVVISGNAGVSGATLSFVDGIQKSVIASADGSYALAVASGWSGTVTPAKTGYSFSPASRNYGGITTNQTAQNYSATAIPQTLVFRSTASHDGWVLESSATSNLGGSINASATTLRLGDEANRRQYRAILSFNTAALPENAVISAAYLRIRQSGTPVGSNPFNSLGNLFADIRKGSFGASTLAAGDFQAAASMLKAGVFGKTPASGWYRANLAASSWQHLNRLGITQFRLYFGKGDNTNAVADYLRFSSGNAVSSKPELVVKFTVP